jgi:hypothetical protein
MAERIVGGYLESGLVVDGEVQSNPRALHAAYMMTVRVELRMLTRPGVGGESCETGLIAIGSDTRDWGLIIIEVPLRKRALSPVIRAVGEASSSRLHFRSLIVKTSVECLMPKCKQSRRCMDLPRLRVTMLDR